jgi:hypothetical protein
MGLLFIRKTVSLAEAVGMGFTRFKPVSTSNYPAIYLAKPLMLALPCEQLSRLKHMPNK